MLLVLVLAFAPFSVMALPGGPGEPVMNGYSGYAWYQGTGAGIVQERYWCDENWENCPGHWTWYPDTKFPYGPDDCGGPVLYGELWDVGDGSDILHPGWWWVCVHDGDVFRQKP